MTRILFFSLISVLFLSCNSKDALFEIEMFTDFQISLGLNTLEAHYFVDTNTPATLSGQLQNLNIDPSEVSQVVANGATLRPKFGGEIDLDFINSVNVFLVDPVDLNRRTEIFFMDFVKFGTKDEIQLFSSISNVTELLLKNNLRIETRLEFRQFPPQTFEVIIDMGFSVFVEE